MNIIYWLVVLFSLGLGGIWSMCIGVSLLVKLENERGKVEGIFN